MLYKIGIRTAYSLVLTFTTAAVVLWWVEGPTLRAIGFGFTAIMILMFTGIVIGEHRNRLHSQDGLSILDEPGFSPNEQSSVVQHPPNRVVMWYKGQPYDFVHNDPTAPPLPKPA